MLLLYSQGERKDKPGVISLFDEFIAPLARGPPSLGLPADERMLDLKVRVIFASEASDIESEVCEDVETSAETMDILQQYIAFSGVMRQAVCPKGAHSGGTYLCNRAVQEQGYLARIFANT